MTPDRLKTLRGWVDAHKMPVAKQEPEDCCCGLLKICKHHAERQETYAKQLPPQTMEWLLDEIEKHQALEKAIRVLDHLGHRDHCNFNMSRKRDAECDCPAKAVRDALKVLESDED